MGYYVKNTVDKNRGSRRGKDKRKSENERVEAEGGRTGGKVNCDMK